MQCPLREKCSTAINGRVIEKSVYQKALEENKKRVEQNTAYYRLRQQVTEHQFGTLKRQWGFTHTLLRGKENVLTEVNIIMLCYNLKRIMSILSRPDLLQWLKGLWLKYSFTRAHCKLYFLRLI